MRAALIREPGGPEALEICDVPVPVPGPGQARIKVAYVGMNPVDAMVRRERLPWMPVEYPLIAGLEHTGVVDSVGEGVDPKRVGSRVISRSSFGGYAEYSLAPADTLIPLDDRIDLKTGCAYRGASFTAWHALHLSARLREGDRVLVHSAAGAIGIMALQIATEAGARPVGLAGGPDKVAFAEKLTACPAVDYLAEGWPSRAIETAEGQRFDIIIDGNGGPNAHHNRDLVARLGRIVYVGATAGDYPAPLSVPELIAGSFSVGGITLTDIEVETGGDVDRHIIDRVATGAWTVPVTEEMDLAEVGELHRRLEARQLMGRAVIRVGP